MCADIKAISLIGSSPLVLVVHPDVPARTVAELIALAKDKPGTLDYGSSGTGSLLHLAGVMFATEAGVALRDVPYRGSSQLTNDLVAGHIKIGFLSLSGALQQINAGVLRPLAVSLPTRVRQLPSIPTMAEAGLPNYSLDGWIAMIRPKDLPAPIVDRLYSEVKAALAIEQVRSEFEVQGVTVIASDPSAAAAHIAAELPKHLRVVAMSGMTAE